MHKIYTCKYFVIWRKYTHVSKMRSHANSVHIRILHLLYSRHVQAVDDRCPIICALALHMGCLIKTIGTKEQSNE